jgi:hypothetical protein
MKNRRTAKYYVVDGKVLSPGDLRRLHRYLIEVESISVISQMRTVVETEWPALAHKLPPKDSPS